MTIKVKATKRGYYGGRLYDAGATFTVADREAIGNWMTPVVEDVKAPKQSKGKKDEPAAEVTEAPEADDLA